MAHHLVQYLGRDGLPVDRRPVLRCARGARQVVVQVAVAEVAEHEGADRGVEPLQPCLHPLHEHRDRFDRQRDVVLQMRAVGALGFGDFLTQLPHRVDLAQRRRYRGVEAQALFQRVADGRFQQRIQSRLVGGVGQFDQHIGRMAVGEGLLHAFRMRQHQIQAGAGEEFEGLQPCAATRVQQREQLQRLLRRFHRGQHHGALIGARQEPQRDRCDDAQRAFGPDQQLLQVVAGVVLAQRA